MYTSSCESVNSSKEGACMEDPAYIYIHSICSNYIQSIPKKTCHFGKCYDRPLNHHLIITEDEHGIRKSINRTNSSEALQLEKSGISLDPQNLERPSNGRTGGVS